MYREYSVACDLAASVVFWRHGDSGGVAAFSWKAHMLGSQLLAVAGAA